MFGYPCPFCSQKLLAAPERAGQRTICPKCLKPIVIPKPDEPKPTVDSLPIVLEPEPDEVPISMMPVSDPDDVRSPTPNVPTPMPEPRPLPRVNMPLGTLADPIPLQPAAAVLLRNPESVADLLPVDLTPQLQSEATPLPTTFPMPEPVVPEPFFNRAPPSFNPAPAYELPPLAQYSANATGAYPMPTFPGVGTITGDHPAATLPPPQHNHQNWNGGGMVVFNPTQLKAEDIAAELTQAISTKMPPPQSPPSDLRLSTGLWLLLTTVGLGLWVYCMIADMYPLWYVAVIGAVELFVGYVWVALAYGRRSTKNGLVTLIPPVWVYRAANPPHEPGYRPLRYVVAGAVLLALNMLGPKARPTLYEWFGISETAVSEAQDSVPTTFYRLLEAERENSLSDAIPLLVALEKPAAIVMEAPADKPKVIETLKRLRNHKNDGIRAAALRAMWTWTPDECKPEVFRAVRSGEVDESNAGHELVSNWKDPETAAFLINRLLATANDTTGLNGKLIPAIQRIAESPLGRASLEDATIPILQTLDTQKWTPIYAFVRDYGGEKTAQTLEGLLKEIESKPQRNEKDRDQASRLRSLLRDVQKRIAPMKK